MNRKSYILLLLPLLLLTFAEVQGARLLHRDIILFSHNQVYVSISQQPLLDGIAESLCSDSTLRVEIVGYGDRTGGSRANQQISYRRAEGVSQYLIKRGVSSSQISFEGRGVDAADSSEILARRVDIFTSVEVEPRGVEMSAELTMAQGEDIIEAIEEEIVESRERREAQREAHIAEVIEERVDENIKELTDRLNEGDAKSREYRHSLPTYTGVSLRTNLLYWFAATPNIGVEYRSSNAVMGYLLNVGYAPLSSQEWEYNLSGYFIAPELRVYIGARKGGYLGLQLMAAGYNVKLSEMGYQGDLYGAGLVAGYRLALPRNFDRDFSLGGGYAMFRYDSYTHHSINDTCTYIDRDVERWQYVPLQAGISLIWRINKLKR